MVDVSLVNSAHFKLREKFRCHHKGKFRIWTQTSVVKLFSMSSRLSPASGILSDLLDKVIPCEIFLLEARARENLSLCNCELYMFKPSYAYIQYGHRKYRNVLKYWDT